MSDPKNLPPDDFGATVPNIKLPQEDSAPNDWEKTNFNFPKPSAPAEADWGKTAVNFNVPPPNSSPDFDKTFMPGTPKPSSPEWGATATNVNAGRESHNAPSEYGATTPYIRLPEAERAKYQNLPPANAPAAEQKEEKKRGIPVWLWAISLLLLFFILAGTLVGAYWIFSRKHGFDVIIKGAQPNSEVFVDGNRWGVTSADGSIPLNGLSAGTKKIEVRNANFLCDPEQISGEDGAKTVEIIAKCRAKIVESPKNECSEIKKGDFAKAAQCANDALDNLKDPVSIDDLLKAMNLYIINFDSGKFDVKPNDAKFLEKASGFIKKLPPNVVIEVGGHTDNRGSKASNQSLSDNRAKAVRDALVKLGVKDTMLQPKGYGDAKPKASNDTDDGRFQNRRIEYSAISK